MNTHQQAVKKLSVFIATSIYAATPPLGPNFQPACLRSQSRPQFANFRVSLSLRQCPKNHPVQIGRKTKFFQKLKNLWNSK
jgi:hypothetical protein